ncbi:uncharacterized protein OCT59_000519 [Rhizophagus irregularis]|uniref:uncharacterized protein n=1 Tax=Rhizophagus irregularis TaxID=588596 RepID=UPI000CB0BFBA|nr:hypothetical protein OCT59_000519 [Rhizophagus irregularis]GBC48036.1 P-loop containing nucleoside triphosphate hydrolase protein [Rhizophagus irregularis DAOM 181602=DAOM 197198]
MNSFEKSPEKTSVQVALRIRPITNEDTNLPTRFQRQVITTSPHTSNQVIVHQNDKKSQTFTFDHVFGPETMQQEVFDNAILNLIDQFLEGYNVTILAYGQTSSGKTHTMGTNDNSSISSESKGIIPRAMETLFSLMNFSQYKMRQFTIKVSFVEIYNEELIDLLGEQNVDGERPQVMIREDSKGNILWSGLQEIKVNNVEEVMTTLARGSLNRQVGSTDMNSQSSRSHAIFSVVMSQQQKSLSSPMSPTNSNSGTPRMNGSRPPSRTQQRMSKRLDDVENMTITSKFNFVDLAGSERLKRTSAVGDRAKEGISINSGLLALGNVISALGDPNKAKHTTHVPYRDSKLTRLLQDSLGGNARTLMIACVSPTEYNLNETINTLKYANRARNIKNSATINQEETGWNDLEHLQSLVMKLRSEIKSLKSNSENFYDDTYAIESGRSTPINFQRGDSSKRSSLNNVETKSSSKKNKDIDLLEDQLRDLQRSYSELSQRYAMTSAELALHQDIDLTKPNNGQSSNQLDVIKEEEEDLSSSAEFRKAVEPIIEEYEKSITSLESQLALSRAAASHTETIMQEQEGKLEYAEQINDQNFNLINDLRGKVANFSQRETVNEQYIKELEFRLENYTKEQNKDQEKINELKNIISQLKTNGTNTQCYITELETRLSSSDQQVTKFEETVEKLEIKLQQREEAFLELESKMKSSYTEEDMRLLRDELEERDHRILQLEKKVDELVHELELLRRLKDNGSKNDTDLTSHSSTSLNSTSTNNQEKLIISTLETKVEELQKVNEQTLIEFDDIKTRYEGCLQEIHELQNQLIEARLNHSDLFDSSPSSPTTPMSPSTPSPNSLRTPTLHRRAISLSTEMNNKEKKDLTHEAVVQKLMKEIQQLELLYDDKSNGLEVFKQGFARLEITHRETLEVVEELREEIKKRDTLAQLEVMSVITHNNGDINEIAEIDENEIIKRLREEVENLREEQKCVLESISEREKEIREKGIQVVKLVSNIRELREKLCLIIEEDQKKTDENNEENKNLINELQTKVKYLEQQLEKAQEEHKQNDSSEKSENNQEPQQKPEEEADEEIIALKLKVEKLQAEIEAKSHTIAVLLLPTVELQDKIRNLEIELHEVRQIHRKALEEKNSIVITNSEMTKENEIITPDENIKELEDKIQKLESQLTKAKEAQYLRTSRITMKPTRIALENLQENLSIQNEQKLMIELQSELDKLKSDIKEKYELIETLKKDLVDKDVIQQKLSEKEAEASSLRLQLSEIKSRDEEMQKQMKQFRIDMEKLESNKGTNEALQSELESVKKELRNSKEKESFAIERLKMLDAEETKIRQEMKRLRHVELLQKERITVLESRYSRQSFGRFNDDVFKLKNELMTSKETESLQQKKIIDLESKLEKSIKDYKSLRTKIDYVKSKILANRNIIEKENQLANETSVKTKKLREEIENLRAQETKNLKKIETLEAQLARAQKDNDVTPLKDELSELRKIKSNLERTVQNLESKLSIAQKESEKLEMIKDEIKLLKELDSDQKSTIERLQLQLQETTLSKDSLTKELDSVRKDLGSQISTLEDELKDAKVELSLETEKYDSSTKKLEDLSKTLKDTQDEGDKKIKKLEGEIEQLRTSGQKDIITLRNQLTSSKLEMETQNELMAKLGKKIKNIEKERDQYVLRNKELTEILEFKEIEQKEAVSNLESIIRNLQMQLVEAENASQIDMKTIKRLRDKLATVEAQLKRAKVTDQKRTQVISELESNLKEINCTLIEKEQTLSTQNALIQELEETVQKIQAKLENAKKSKDTEYERVKELELKLDEFKIKYEGSNLDELNDNLNKIKNELEKVRNSEAEKTELVKSLESQLKEAIINRDQEISKLQEATAEIEVLKKQYEQLKNQISENDDSSLQNNNTDNSSIIENLTNQLKEARNESKMHRERVEELENITKQLESDKSDQMKTNENLLQQVEQLQKELGSLAEEFSDPNTKHEDADVLSNEQKKPENDTNKTKSRRSIIFNRNLSLKKSKNKDDESSNLAFAKLTEVNNSLRKTNENLTSKIIQAQTRMNALSEKIKHLESELMSIKLFENDASNSDGSVKNLKEKIRELEAEKEGLEQANSVSNEERSKLDQKIKSLLEQLESVGKGGNETALQLSALNNKIIELENEVSSLKQQSTTNTTEMEKEISKLLEINDKLGKEVQKNEIKNTVKRNSMPTQESEPTSPTRPRTTSLDGSLQTKLLQQENAIMEQENLIKILREKIFELETRTDDDSSYDASSNSGMLDLDAVGAVGGFRRSASNLSETAKKKNKKSNVASVANYPMTPPPTPPPSHSLSSLLMANSPTSPGSRSPTHGFGALSPPPRNFNSPTPGFDINNAQPAELVQEIQKLHRKIVKIEGDNIENSDHIGNLESSLKENETNLRVAKQQLQILQREKTDLLDQIKKLRSQLDEATALFENAKSSVQEEKKVIENVLEEERRAKENAEKARRQLENQMEELMAKRSKFMCF